MDLSEHPDAWLIGSGNGVEHDAFTVLYRRYEKQIYAYHYRRCANRDMTHDLVAETFMRAWSSRRSFRDEARGSAAPWLHGIARNVLRTSLRRRQREEALRQRMMSQRCGSDTQPMPEPWCPDRVSELLDVLNPGHRRAVELRVLEELSYEDVARALAITPENARVRVHRALASLRDSSSAWPETTGAPS